MRGSSPVLSGLLAMMNRSSVATHVTPPTSVIARLDRASQHRPVHPAPPLDARVEPGAVRLPGDDEQKFRGDARDAADQRHCPA
jgi:hypothetical protein